MHILSGKYRHRKLTSPGGDQTKPTTSRLRETVFNILQNEIEGSEFLDIFAGSGAMGLEALSRGASLAIFIENHPLAIRCLKANLKSLGIEEKNALYLGDFQKGLKRLLQEKKQFNIAFADAPYTLREKGERISQFLLDWFQEHPLLKKGGFLLIEDQNELPPASNIPLQLLSTRRSGAAYLHLFQNG